MKEIEQVEDEVTGREELTLQNFFDDMDNLGMQVRGVDKKPTFDYGQLAITNYLLWLMLGELKMLNEKTEEDDA